MLFLSMNAFSMPFSESFILTNDGSKINIKTNFFRIDNAEKIVFYKLPNSDAESRIKFKDFDYIHIGSSKFKTYKLNNSKEIVGYFVLSETTSKTLIFTTKTDEDEESTKVNYAFYILDSNNNIIDSLQFDNIKSLKSSNIRGDIYSKIQFYFSDCDMLMKRIDSYDNLSAKDQNLGILDFFNSPVYTECHK
ncbi:hypothetical protein [Flavobacterium aquicola]|uniref:Uncharacterized protein n=1 Tax=Flavobacterium aquicola TaxID=1682742 RepID=A0A3E0EIV3_9FLAO|nr:hypothetical protein [Flavobacterium aquicola]REG98111.1 hypothetical protein C8P67_10734 [Flavobacterium aquicola]